METDLAEDEPMMPSTSTVTRKVHFFRISHPEEILPSLPESLRLIENLPWREQGRYQQDASDESLLSVLPHSFDFPLRIEFGRTRRDNLPAIERRGVKKTLSIAEDAGLIDVCHIVIFADGFVAAEFNRDAPRIKKLGDYLYFKGQNLTSVPRFQRLFERDLIPIIENMDKIAYLELEMPPDNIALTEAADKSLYHALKAQREANKSRTIGMYFNSSNPDDGRLKSMALALAKIINNSESPSDFEKLEIRGVVGGNKNKKRLNLLEYYLTEDVVFKKISQKARSVDSEAAFYEIEAAYLRKCGDISFTPRGFSPWDY